MPLFWLKFMLPKTYDSPQLKLWTYLCFSVWSWRRPSCSLGKVKSFSPRYTCFSSLSFSIFLSHHLEKITQSVNAVVIQSVSVRASSKWQWCCCTNVVPAVTHFISATTTKKCTLHNIISKCYNAHSTTYMVKHTMHTEWTMHNCM